MLGHLSKYDKFILQFINKYYMNIITPKNNNISIFDNKYLTIRILNYFSPRNITTVSFAKSAKLGNIEVMKWLYLNGYPWDYDIFLQCIIKIDSKVMVWFKNKNLI